MIVAADAVDAAAAVAVEFAAVVARTPLIRLPMMWTMLTNRRACPAAVVVRSEYRCHCHFQRSYYALPF